MNRLIILIIFLILTGLFTLKSQESNQSKNSDALAPDQMADEIGQELDQLEHKTQLLLENHSKVEQTLWQTAIPAARNNK